MNFNFNAIYDFCKVRNLGTAAKNGNVEYPPRVKFLLELIESYNIPYEVDTYEVGKNNNLHNIYLKGTSDKWVMAHHDVCNHRVDNANDNSASVINAIALKTIRPDINIALVDGEEPPLMGAGSSRFANLVQEGKLNVNWVLNLELSGIGGENFFIGKYDTPLTKKIESKFGCSVMNVPFNDAAVLIRKAGINAALINPCPLISSYKVTSVGDSASEYLSNMSNKKIDHYNRIIQRLNDQKKRTKAEHILADIEIDIHEYKELLKKEESKSAFSLGDILSQNEFNRLPNSIIDDMEYEEVQPNIVGRMPRIDEMDISILHRCHTTDDVVEHMSTSDMKDFVTKVLSVICDID